MAMLREFLAIFMQKAFYRSFIFSKSLRSALLYNSTSFITERSWKKGSRFLESAAKQKLFQEKKFYQKALLIGSLCCY